MWPVVAEWAFASGPSLASAAQMGSPAVRPGYVGADGRSDHVRRPNGETLEQRPTVAAC